MMDQELSEMIKRIRCDQATPSRLKVEQSTFIRPRFRHIVNGCFAVGLVFFMAGCGVVAKQGTIAGVVSLDGKPVSGGFVSFTLTDGMPHTVEIQGDGTYRVEGVPLGEAIVTVASPPVDDKARQMNIKLPKEAPPPPPAPRYPEKYAGMATSDLRYVVHAGDNNYNVEMKR